MARCGSRVSGCARARARFGWLEPGLSSRRDRALSRGSGAYHREPAFVEPYIYKDAPFLQTKYSCPNPGQEEMAESDENVVLVVMATVAVVDVVAETKHSNIGV